MYLINVTRRALKVFKLYRVALGAVLTMLISKWKVRSAAKFKSLSARVATFLSSFDSFEVRTCSFSEFKKNCRNSPKNN